MVAGITTADGVFSVREPMWHGLGHVLEGYPTRREAQALTMPWEPVTEPIYRQVPTFDATGQPTTSYEPIESHQAVVRSDNGADLGVVGEGYQPVTNDELWDIAETLQGQASDVKFETAGSLQGGRKVWILVRLDEPITLTRDPQGETVPYFALQNAHDGSGSFRGQATMTRIVCQNTSRVADMDAERRGTQFTFRHTKNVGERVEEARQALAGWRESVQEWRLFADFLAAQRVSDAQVLEFAERFIPMPAYGTISERVQRNVETARGELLGCLRSETCEGIEHTAWGLVQAATEYVQWHRRANSHEGRFHRTYLKEQKVVTDAADIARDLVAV